MPARRRSRRAPAARRRCSAGTSSWARRPARRAAPAAAGRCRAGRRRGAARLRSCRCPAPPCTTSTPPCGARITWSCSAWMVATMSVIRPVRAAPSAASSAASPAGPVSRAASGSVEVEHLVVDPGHLAQPGADVPAPADALRPGRGGDVERPRRGRSPVQQQRLVVALVVDDAEPADVPALAVLEVQPTEAEPVLRGVELAEPAGPLRGRAVPLGHALVRGGHAADQGLGEVAGGSLAQPIELLVEHRHVLLLGRDVPEIRY